MSFRDSKMAASLHPATTGRYLSHVSAAKRPHAAPEEKQTNQPITTRIHEEPLLHDKLVRVPGGGDGKAVL